MTTDPVIAFLDAMESAGVVPAEPIADRLGPDKVRFRCEGDGKGRKNGWARFYSDGIPAGSFGNYRLQVAEKWRLNDGRELTPAERGEMARQFKEQERRRKALRDAEQSAVADACRAEWESAGEVNPAHPYLARKGVSGEGLRQLGTKLLVPMRDEHGRLWNLQRISPDGSKFYVKGGRATGLFLLIGEPRGTICVGEGYATMATIRRVSGHAVAVAFSAANLKPVAVALDARFPRTNFTICADDDSHLIANPRIARNIGVEAAEEAARAVGGRVAIPPRKENP